MKPQDAPKLERRRAADFERELLTRARTWIPSWSLDEGEADFGLALLKIAARFNSEVAERLDRAGEKMALGFLDWLGLPALAARPARLPVVLKMAETALEPVPAQQPIKMQVDVGDSTVTFETETDLQVIPGQLAAVVAVDPDADSYYLPPPGLMSLDSLEPLPTAWKLKNFAAARSKTLQVDPGIGLAEGMLVEIDGQQFRVVQAKDDLVTIEPPVPEGDGYEAETRISKVENFLPFNGARNLQEHVLYIGDSDALNIEAAARIEVLGPPALREGATWEYLGNNEGSEGDATWLALPVSDAAPDRLIFDKPKGEVEEKEVEGKTARWLRAKRVRSERIIEADKIELKVNPSDLPPLPLSMKVPAPEPPPVELFVNATPSPTRDTFLFGQEPRLFDTLYVGCAEAFSKASATATIEFDLSDGAFDAMSTFSANKHGQILAAVDKGGTLHLFRIDADGKLRRLNNGEPLRPEPRDATDSGASNFSLTSSNIRPVVWLVWDTLFVAVASKGEVWVRVETPATQVSGFISFTFPPVGRWEYWGSPLGDPDKAITGMAIVNQAGVPTLVVMTADGELKRKSAAGAGWQDQPLTLPANHLLLDIVSIRSANSFKAADNFLAVTAPTAVGPFTLRTGPGGADAIQNIDPTEITPFGFEASGTTTTVAAKRNPTRLVAKRNTVTEEVELDGVVLTSRMLDGNSDGGELTVFGVGELSGQPVLLSWTPYDPDLEDLPIATPIEILTGAPKGPVALIGARLFLPGDRKGEVLTTTVGTPDDFQAAAADFNSVVAVSSAVTLPATIDRLFVVDSASAALEVNIEGPRTAGTGDFAASTFLWLDTAVGRDTASDDVFIFPPAPGTLPTGDILSHSPPATPTESEFDIHQVLDIGTVLIVEGSGGEEIVRIAAMNGTVATVTPALNDPVNDSPGFRTPQKVAGRIFPSLKLDATNNNLDAARVLTSGLYLAEPEPHRQPVIALAETGSPATPEYLALGLEWTVAPAGTVNFYVSTVSAWSQARATTSATAVLAWEYWDGTSWSVLELTADNTSHLRQSGTVEFVVPPDLKPVDWAGKTNYWVRARLIGGNYGEAKVEVVTQQSGTTSTQTVKRTTDDLQPPYALGVAVTYAVDNAVTPRFVLTRDSGSTRDQSDANRTPGAQVEIFTPLSVTLDRLDAPTVAASPAEKCVPDCECEKGMSSMSPAPELSAGRTLSEPASASGSGRRAIYLGFTSKLLGQPVNVLFNVARESDYDAIGPLRVDALIGDRFAPIVSTDDSRALGETGILTMAFDVAPLKTDLFGQTLSWLRVAPRIASTDWKPSLAGVYPNGVWTRSAETMTRELLGSSDGRPLLTVTLARPPLLQDSLQLRIREPLGEEERKDLTDRDPELVKSNVTDLPGDWVLWTQVTDPTDCGPRDRVYSLDEATGAVHFGDGRHGMIPPAGIDGIVAFEYERTDPAVSGRLDANLVTPRTELNLVTPVESVETILAADQSAGGVAPESPQRVLQFAPATLRHRGRAVSLRDFEDLARQKSDDVVQARAFRRNGRVRLVVVTKGAKPVPNRALQRELRQTLLEIAPVGLGARNAFIIAAPRLRRLRISLVLRVFSLDLGGTVANEAKKRLVSAFEPVGGWSLGQSPREDDVAEALIDIPDLDGIVSIGLFELDEASVARPWQRPVGRAELVVLSPQDVRIGFEVREAAA